MVIIWISKSDFIFLNTILDAVRVSYEAEQGSLVPLTDGQTLATANEDFNPETQSVVLEDGVASTVIRVPIIDVSNLHC